MEVRRLERESDCRVWVERESETGGYGLRERVREIESYGFLEKEIGGL